MQPIFKWQAILESVTKSLGLKDTTLPNLAKGEAIGIYFPCHFPQGGRITW
jgi:hypothetical protein